MIEAVAWPIATFVFAGFATLLFRKPIERVLERISSASKDGVLFGRPQDLEPPKLEAVGFDELIQQPISATVIEREKSVVADLDKLPLKSDSERIVLLRRAIASLNVELEYTRVAHIIFGSQLNFLVQLAGTRNGLPRSHAENMYSEAVKNFPDVYANRQFGSWMDYLIFHGLVVLREDRIDITQYGTDFLKYLVDARLAYPRVG
ncbi:MAG: hypothetical protein HEQ39_08495 [Rhizobacter sp.]